MKAGWLDNPVSQHGIASYVTKFESQSFRLRGMQVHRISESVAAGSKGTARDLRSYFEPAPTAHVDTSDLYS